MNKYLLKVFKIYAHRADEQVSAKVFKIYAHRVDEQVSVKVFKTRNKNVCT